MPLSASSPRTTPAPLQGLRMGMVCGDEGAPGAMLFQQAARELGAQVTVLDPTRVIEDGAALEDVARLLGRLYGAIACDGLPPAVLRRLATAAVVPVVDVQAVLAPVDGRGTEAEKERRRITHAVQAAEAVQTVQAALLAALR
ncbi:hypothetical protein ACFJIX_24465 [Roseateles sp. UC29_93]|uniref:hypothetical protein n=1 Tax=Roseateles sp. UC29_93 TaxID=3350177 RepID=UPI00366C3FB0